MEHNLGKKKAQPLIEGREEVRFLGRRRNGKWLVHPSGAAAGCPRSSSLRTRDGAAEPSLGLAVAVK